MVNKTNLADDVHWKISDLPVPYPEALSFMEERVDQIHKGEAAECIWLLEHPPSTQPERAHKQVTSSHQIDFLSMKQGVAANTLITGLGKKLPMSC